MNILVCGGAGYIGSHTVRQLLKAGYEVLVLDNLINGHVSAIGGVPYIKVDITDKPVLDQVLSKYKFDAVMHFAAFSQVGESMQHPYIYYHNNVIGTLNLLKFMLDAKIKYHIFSSTAAVYGEPIQMSIKEDHPTVPTNPYGATKLAVEGMLQWYASAYGLKYISLRYFNAAGADLVGDIGEYHNPETHLIPLVLKVALGLMPDIKLFGTDYPTPDGTCIRDYVHVTDLADAHVLALEYLLRGGVSNFFNLGNEKGFSVLEVLRTAEEVVGHTIEKKYTSRRQGDPAVLVASSGKIKAELGWEQQFGDLKRIIETAWKWHKTHPKGYN